MSQHRKWLIAVLIAAMCTALLVFVVFLDNSGYLAYLIYPVGSYTETNSSSGSSDVISGSSLAKDKIGDSTNSKININNASMEDLCTLPGVGETIARSIIEYREANGNFQTVDELLQVKRIGPVVLEKLRPYIVAQ